MSKMVYQIDSKNIAGVLNQVNQMINKAIFRGPVEVVLQRPKRTQDQNSKLHPMIRDIKTQIEWMGLATEKEWRQFFCGIIKGQKPVPTPEGGIIMIGGSSRDLTKPEMSDCIEYMYAFGSERNVVWSEPSQQLYKQYKEAA